MINWTDIHNSIESADKIVITTHIMPDGDGLGSSVAMYHHLKEVNKDCRIYIASEIPEEYEFLNKGDIIHCYTPGADDAWIQNADLAVIFDVGDFMRMKTIGELLSVKNIPMLNIDHHPIQKNSPFTVNAVETSVAATGELVYDYLNSFRKKPITLEMWEGLYTAVLTDTGSFAYSNTTIKCHQIAIEAIKAGVNTAKIHQDVYQSRPLEKMKLLSKVIDNVELDCNGELAWFAIDEKMVASVGANRKHVDGFTDMVRGINGVEVAVMIFENGDSCRVNFRSKGKYIVNSIALELGGGGHQLACGAVVMGSLDEVIPKVLELTKAEIASQNEMER
jgi:phosphoesterase RecJ-like protein